MPLDSENIESKLASLVESYSTATEVGCRAFDRVGREITCSQSNAYNCQLCNLIKKIDVNNIDCQRSHLYGGLQAEKLGEAYIYFCPYGLVNWAVPIIINELKYVIIGGPVLMHPVDDFMIQQIIKENLLLKSYVPDIRKRLNDIDIVEPVKVRHLAELLFYSSASLVIEDQSKLAERKELNSLSAQLAGVVHRLKKEPQDYPFELEKELIFNVKVGNQQIAKRILNEILGYVYFHSGSNFEVVRLKAIGLMDSLARAAIEVGADLEIIFGLEYTYLSSLGQAHEVNELSGLLIKVLDRFIECTFSLKNVKNKDLIFKAMNYIRNHYDKEISLEDVASEVGLTSAYFSSLFKEETQLTYTEYLNRVRVEVSKQLLEKQNSLANVALMVGFNDQSYFSKVFKKIVGVSPGKWRQIN